MKRRATIFSLLAVSPLLIAILMWQTWSFIVNPIEFWLDGLKGLIVAVGGTVIGFYIFNKYFLPGLMSEMGRNTVRDISEDPEFKPMIDSGKALIEKGKKVMEKLEPIVEKAKNLDLEKVSEDLKPFLEAVKQIDAKTLNETIKSLKELTDTVKGSLTKPKIPEPD